MTKLEDHVVRYIKEYLETFVHNLDEDDFFDDVALDLQALHYITGTLCTWAATRRYMEEPGRYLEDMGLIFTEGEN